jgi:hypothetical protein
VAASSRVLLEAELDLFLDTLVLDDDGGERP